MKRSILREYSHGNNELMNKYIFTNLFFYSVVVYDNRIIPLRMNDDFSSSLKDTSAFFFIFLNNRLTIRASCLMDLSDFPMDTQRCPLNIGSCKHNF